MKDRRCASCSVLLAGRCFLVGVNETIIERPSGNYRFVRVPLELWLCARCYYRRFAGLNPLPMGVL